MKLLLIATILASLQLVHFFMEYYDSKKNKRLHLLKRNITDYYLDWIFIPLNFLVVYAVHLNLKLVILFFALSLLINTVVHSWWIKTHKKAKNETYMFDINTRKIHFSGIVHFLFSTIETVLIAVFFFSPVISWFFYIVLSLLFIYFLFLVLNSKKINRGKLEISDLIVCVIGMIAIATKIVLNFL